MRSPCFLFQLCWFANVWQLLIKVGTLKAKQKQNRSKQHKTTPQTGDKEEEEEPEDKKNR